MLNPVITFGIPSYNGAQTLAGTLDSIIKGLSKETLKEVELLVSDNAFTDDTSSIITKYQAQFFDLISYYKNEINVGFDKNADLAIRRAKANFVWIIGNGDRLKPGAAQRLLNILKELKYTNEIAALFVNYDGYDIPKFEEGLCENGNIFFAKTKFKNVFFTSNIVNKDIWINLDLSKYSGLGYIHMGYLIEAMAKYKGYVIYDSLITPDDKPQAWGEKGNFFMAGLNLVELYQSMYSLNYDEAIIRSVTDPMKCKYYFYLPLARAQGLKINFQILRRMYRLFCDYWSFWLLVVPLLIVPSFVYKFIHRTYLIMRNLYNLLKKGTMNNA